MGAKLRSWWKQIKRPLEVAVIIISLVIVIVLIIVVILGYLLKWGWTGLSQRGLWDWLQLLIIPLVLAIAALLFNLANARTERQIAQQRYEHDQQIALDKQREDLLQAYLDRMSELLLKEGLRSSALDAEVRNVARVRTITVLFQLDARRIGYVLAFLREAKLLSNEPNMSIVSLSQTNFRKINFSNIDLSNVDLSRANLREANLSGANLTAADLSGADLRNTDLTATLLSTANLSTANLNTAFLRYADLREADLSGADLRGADFWGADLSKANLKKADLSGADLTAATLTEADLKGATFSGDIPGEWGIADTDLIISSAMVKIITHKEAILDGADLSGAILDEADLREVRVTTEQLDKAKSLRDAIMPDGTKHP